MTKTITQVVRQNQFKDDLMDYKPIKEFVTHLVNEYAIYKDNHYRLFLHQIPEFDVDYLAGLFLQFDTDYAIESIGFDNPDFIPKILPALTKWLQNSTDNDFEIEFVQTLKTAIITYLSGSIQALIDRACMDKTSYDHDGLTVRHHKDNNELWIV